MLNLSRQVREIVGWKSGPSNATTSTKHTRETTAEDSTTSNASTPQPQLMNPSAKPFQPGTSASKRTRKNGAGTELEEGEEDDEMGDEIGTPSSSTSNPSKKRKTKGQANLTTATAAADEEEEEGSIPTAPTSITSTTVSAPPPSRGRRGASFNAPLRGGSVGGRGRGGRGRGRPGGGGGPSGWD